MALTPNPSAQFEPSTPGDVAHQADHDEINPMLQPVLDAPSGSMFRRVAGGILEALATTALGRSLLNQPTTAALQETADVDSRSQVTAKADAARDAAISSANTYTDAEVATRETPAGAQAKANAARDQANAYTDAEVDKAVKAGAIKPRGSWDAGTAYDAGDMVSHAGTSWYTLVDTSAGEEPGVSPKWHNYAGGIDKATADADYVGHGGLDVGAVPHVTALGPPTQVDTDPGFRFAAADGRLDIETATQFQLRLRRSSDEGSGVLDVTNRGSVGGTGGNAVNSAIYRSGQGQLVLQRNIKRDFVGSEWRHQVANQRASLFEIGREGYFFHQQHDAAEDTPLVGSSLTGTHPMTGASTHNPHFIFGARIEAFGNKGIVTIARPLAIGFGFGDAGGDYPGGVSPVEVRAAGFGQIIRARQLSAETATSRVGMRLVHDTSSDSPVDGFGVGVEFAIRRSGAAAERLMGAIRGQRFGEDETGSIVIQTPRAGASTLMRDRVRIDHEGLTLLNDSTLAFAALRLPNGPTLTNGRVEMRAMSIPANAPADELRVFAFKSGGGKMQLRAIGPTGISAVIWEEP